MRFYLLCKCCCVRLAGTEACNQRVLRFRAVFADGFAARCFISGAENIGMRS